MTRKGRTFAETRHRRPSPLLFQKMSNYHRILDRAISILPRTWDHGPFSITLRACRFPPAGLDSGKEYRYLAWALPGPTPRFGSMATSECHSD